MIPTSKQSAPAASRAARPWLLALPLSALVACGSSRGPKVEPPPPGSGDKQAAAVADAQAAARQGVVDDLYEQWRYDYVLYRKAVEDALAREAAAKQPEAADPVRSLDEILRESDPEAHNPDVKRLFDQWLAQSQKYDSRLRQLANDPDADPRSPLRPEVREALVPPKAPAGQ